MASQQQNERPEMQEEAVQSSRETAPADGSNQDVKRTQTPPFPYQEQPLQEQKSSDYAPYPNQDESHQQQQNIQREERWGTPGEMGAPSHPEAHPDNKEAAAGKLSAKDTTTEPEQDSTPPASKSKLSFADVTEFSKKMEILIGHLWGHLTTGPSVADTAFGRMSAGTRLLTHGGFQGVFTSSFKTDPDEKLKKTYACFLSTATGPVPGTLFISTKRLAFCSDRPLRYTPPTQPSATAAAQGNAAKTDGPANGHSAETDHDPAKADVPAKEEPAKGDGAAKGDAARFSYYKVAIPVEKIKEVDPSVNPNKPAEKYIELVTVDNYEFWFMGFVNYDKGVKNLQEAVGSPQQQQ